MHNDNTRHHFLPHVRPTLLATALALAVCAPTFASAQEIAGGGPS